ncbi:type 1 periplasmic binding fold superfamily protein [Flavobacteriaceae bacterium]|jgi:hypothetical protein|nr:type 1 periplasmic binding fold superfamily protein [Flavobacteriaceae bacterium]
MKFSLNIQYKTLYLLLSLLIISCSKDDPEPINEEELITTVQLTFKSPGITDQTVRWQEGSNNSDIISLAANTQYEVEIIFLDESDPSDIEDITEEVKEEADEHQVFYQFSQLNISLGQSSSDTLDSNQNPLYVNSLWNTSEAGSGTVRVYLIHEPVTKSSSTRDGFAGETDVTVDFPINIE